jgi:hypothetical protein
MNKTLLLFLICCLAFTPAHGAAKAVSKRNVRVSSNSKTSDAALSRIPLNELYEYEQKVLKDFEEKQYTLWNRTERIETLCKEDIETNRDLIISLYREFHHDWDRLYSDFFKDKVNFEYTETADEIVINTPTKSKIRKVKHDKWSDDEIIDLLKSIFLKDLCEYEQKVLKDFEEREKMYDLNCEDCKYYKDWERIKTLCQKDAPPYSLDKKNERRSLIIKHNIEANRKEIISLFRKYGSLIQSFYRDFFKDKVNFKYTETDDEIIIKTPTKSTYIRGKKVDKITDDEIIDLLKKEFEEGENV